MVCCKRFSTELPTELESQSYDFFLLKIITNIEEAASHVDDPELSSDAKPDWERKFAPYGSQEHPFFLPLQPFLDQIKSIIVHHNK